MAKPSIPYDVVTYHDMTVDSVDNLPRFSVDLSEYGGPTVSVRLAPCAVRALVDALAGVAEPAPGEVRVIVKARAEDIGRVLADLHAAVRTPGASVDIREGS